jgi:hypothetical protein
LQASHEILGLLLFVETISQREGVFDTDNKEKITFIGRDINKNNKFVVLRTVFTKSETLGG